MFKRFSFIGVFSLLMLTPFLAQAAMLERQLELGMTGADVTALQTFLAADPSIYPQGLITGYFGVLTSAAVSNFQSSNGIANVGRVGPITLAAINNRMAGGISSNTSAPTITGVGLNVGRNNATVAWNTNEFAKGMVYYSSTPLTTYERVNAVDVSGTVAMTDANYYTSQGVALSNLLANTTYYYMVYTTDQSGNVSVTWPSNFKTAN